jgi:hypothetical protein
LIVRLTVPDLDAADELMAMDAPGPVRVVPLIAMPANRFGWRWPLRVGVLAGLRAEAWRERMTSSSHHGRLYEVVERPADRDLDILVVDDEAVPPGTELLSLRQGQAACVIMVGARTPVHLLLERAVTELDPTVAAGVTAPDAAWFVDFFHELSHDQPIDVALALGASAVRVAGDPELVNLTAVGRWAAAIAAQGTPDGDGTAEELRWILAHGDFTFESHAATEICDAVWHLMRGKLVLERGGPMATAPPPLPPPLPPHTPTVPRRLVPEIVRGDEVCRRALVPDTEYRLEVQIRLPETPDEGVPFVEDAVPEGDGVVRLDVRVSCPDIRLRASAPIDLPTTDRSEPSTVATFGFRTGPDGTPLDIEILVLHGNRPIQAARVLAPVRTTPARRDKVRILAVPLSAQPEPARDATHADLSLDARNGRLEVVGGADGILLGPGDVKDLLDDIELRASRFLAGTTDAVWQAGKRAPSLLIDLARLGSQLHRKLADVDDAAARTVSLLIRHDTAILPLEIAYAGPTPRRTAKLCAHATGAPPALNNPCPKASTLIVCPYAFWGMYRTIARTIQGPGNRRRKPRRLGPLSLRPVLYGATNRADKGLPAGTLEADHPSLLLQQSLRDCLGGEVARVTNWRAWRTHVRDTHPELLVVFGHSEIDRGEKALQIGKTSWLHQPDVTEAVVAAAGSAGPLVLLLACATAVPDDRFFGALPASFTDRGAAAVVATLSKLKGPDGARAASAIVSALVASSTPSGVTLGTALAAARRNLVNAGQLVGLMLVGHGEIDLKLFRA